MSKTSVFALALLLATPALAQTITIERKETWTIQQYDELRAASVDTLQKLKTLPDGYHHFLPVANPIRVYSDGMIICKQMKNAISFGKRLWEGDNPMQATRKIIKANGGDPICYNRQDLVLTSTEVAIRGDDEDNRIHITKWVDQNGRVHYTGSPCHTRNCL